MKCTFCDSPAFGYIHGFQWRRKIGSFPACQTHFAIAWAYAELGQEWLRDSLARILPIRKGSLPRLAVSLSS